MGKKSCKDAITQYDFQADFQAILHLQHR